MRLATVFLPTFDGLPFVRETVASLLAQRHGDFELVVLDDGSADGTPEALAALNDPRLRVVRGAHAGIPGNWNRAFELAETPYLALAHQDDLYDPEYLGAMVSLLAARPRAFIAHCRCRTIDAAGEPLAAPADRYKDGFWPAAEPYERGGREELAALRRGSYVMAPTVMFRTAAARTIGPFHAGYRQAADWEYWLRGVLAGWTVVGTHRRLVAYRRHASMATRRSVSDHSRYEEEVRVLSWVAGEAHRLGLADDPRADHRIVGRMVLSELAARLADGDVAAARALLRFAVNDVPGFRRSTAHLAAQGSCLLGEPGGRLLQLLESAWLSTSELLRGQPGTPAAPG